MKLLLINLIVAIFLISCATYSKGYKKNYHDELITYACDDLRMIEIDDLARLITLRNSRLYRNCIIISAIYYPVAIAFLLAPAPGSRPDLFSDNVCIVTGEIDNMKMELKIIKKVTKEKNCPKEINYEIISDKSHSSHLPH